MKCARAASNSMPLPTLVAVTRLLSGDMAVA
jgi:hypothetical protein